MRLLPERADHDGQGAAGQKSESHRSGNSRGDEPHAVPLHDVLPSAGGNQTRVKAARGDSCDRGKGGAGMTAFTNIPKRIEELLQKSDGTIARRSFLKGAGMLVVSLGVAGSHPLVR